ncbi:MAG: transcription elongation factor GreA [Chloroflexi bacterium]|nr:transcription elongation factor GreA [Chloroflexota bacterium]MCH8892333.1 transcription elongation factor GreA [Chloroflexota bacterium]MCI0788628.1 transcription elongation factor GreA [Chloroflexota bacterium]MCI0801009.1 transcription elongation factor GreA [Chloroflexota bacterium]MCI0811988.1 transcription elongation factor GreA [Chloroflexota bacterium]
MTTEQCLSISEALTHFVAAKKSAKSAQQSHQELGRFVAWCGRERKVSELSPSEVAEYAQQMGLGGSESVQRLGPVKIFLAYWKDQGWIENGLASHLRVPRTRRTTAAKPTSRSNGRATFTGSHLSQEGYDRMVSQLDDLKDQRALVLEDIKRAMADKDFRENAPLDAAKDQQGIIELRIRELESSINNAQILPEGASSKVARSSVGAKVTLKDTVSGKTLAYTLVDVREADISAGKISTTSPVGEALLDRMVGEEVTINVPKGTLRYLVQRITAIS